MIQVACRGLLGWEPGILNGVGDKPKWMRWRTFERLVARHNQSFTRSIARLMLKLEVGAD